MACGWLSPAPGMVKLGSGLIGTREGTAQTGRDHAGWTEAPPRAQDLGQRPGPAGQHPAPRAAERELSLTRTASHGRPHTEPAARHPGNAPHAAELAAAARQTRGDIRRQHGSESVKRWNDVSKRNKSTGRWDRTGRFADAGTDFPEPKTRRRTEGFGRRCGASARSMEATGGRVARRARVAPAPRSRARTLHGRRGRELRMGPLSPAGRRRGAPGAPLGSRD